MNESRRGVEEIPEFGVRCSSQLLCWICNFFVCKEWKCCNFSYSQPESKNIRAWVEEENAKWKWSCNYLECVRKHFPLFSLLFCLLRDIVLEILAFRIAMRVIHSHFMCAWAKLREHNEREHGMDFESLMSAVLCNHNVKMDGLGSQLFTVYVNWRSMVVITLLSFRFSTPFPWNCRLACVYTRRDVDDGQGDSLLIGKSKKAILNLLERTSPSPGSEIG